MKALASIVLVGVWIASAAQGFNSLKLSAAIEKTQIVPGEPLMLRVTASNLGAQPVKAHRDLTPAFGMLEIAVERPGGKFLRVLGPGWGTSEARPRGAELAPGAQQTAEVLLFSQAVLPGREDLGTNRLIFDRVGKYRIQVKWQQLGFNESITAPVLTVEVVEPQGADRRVFDALQADSALTSLLAGGARAGSVVVAKAEQLIAGNTDSMLARHVSLALGRHALRANEAARAIPVLTNALSAPTKSFLRCSAVLALAEAYARTGAVDKATALLDGAASDFEGSAQRPRFDQMRAELKKKQD